MPFRRLAVPFLNLVCAGSVLAQGHQTQSFAAGAVVSDSKLASDAGASILKKGGNAVDAAVATGFALAVTFPEAGNLGGGGFMLVRMEDGKTVAIDYRETAPAAATANMYLDEKGNILPRLSTVGHLAAGVPGTVRGLAEAHKRFGKLPWKTVVQPAYDLAAKGFPVSVQLSKHLQGQSSVFKQFAESYRVFCRDGNFWKPDEKLVQPDLAKTLGRIRDFGADDFYTGKTAQLIADDMQMNKGLITLKDLVAYKPVVREPLRGTFRGDEILTMPPPSSGGIALLAMLNMVEKDSIESMEWGSAPYIHLLVECQKRAFADRSEFPGDPDFIKVPVGKLIDKSYGQLLRSQISLERATPSKEIRPGANLSAESMETTHFSVVDKNGNAVSNTYTLNGSFGSSAMVKGAGFLLNNEMDDFTSKVGSANMFGLIQGPQNSIAPGKRPLSSMTPTILVRNGKLFMAVGSPGGPTIINTVFETYLNVVLFRMNIQRAVSVPRFHHQWLPDQITVEPYGLSRETRLALIGMGHRIQVVPPSFGSCMGIVVDEKTGRREAGVDPRLADGGASGH